MRLMEKADYVEEIHGIEISQSAVSMALSQKYYKLGKIQVFDGYKIPYPDKYFSCAYASHVIEHVEHPRILLREMRRVSSCLVLEVPLNYKFYIEKQFEGETSVGHINVYSPALFRFFIRTEGFIIKKQLLSVPKIAALNKKAIGAIPIQLVKRVVRFFLTLPIIRTVTDGLGYCSITVLVE